MTQYIIVLIIIPGLAYLASILSAKFGWNFWLIYVPLLVIGLLIYQYSGRIFKK